MSAFAVATLAGWIFIVVVAAIVRGRFYATFAAVLLGIQTACSLPLEPYFARFPYGAPVYVYLQTVLFIHYLSLVRSFMKPWPYRALVSVPASFMAAGTALAFPWAIAAGLGFTPHGVWIPYAVAAVGTLQSLFGREEEKDIVLGEHLGGGLQRVRQRAQGKTSRALRVVQITDPHLGPFMSAHRLRQICERTVARKPDLVLLTGDFLTMESHHATESLAYALEPLKPLEGRTFACRGNHDLEAPDTVERGLRAAGVRLLVDDSVVVETDAGRVQIVGADFRWRERDEHLRAVCAAHPRVEGTLRLVLLHDPGAFHHLPEGEGDLVLSGHTHGGQLGLVSLGLAITALTVFAPKLPDHGLWSRGRDRLYVHRGTGVYGFPLRIGVPSEQSVLRIHRE